MMVLLAMAIGIARSLSAPDSGPTMNAAWSCLDALPRDERRLGGLD